VRAALQFLFPVPNFHTEFHTSLRPSLSRTFSPAGSPPPGRSSRETNTASSATASTAATARRSSTASTCLPRGLGRQVRHPRGAHGFRARWVREPKRGHGQKLGEEPLHKGWAQVFLNPLSCSDFCCKLRAPHRSMSPRFMFAWGPGFLAVFMKAITGKDRKQRGRFFYLYVFS
jgi:hypothetical protein